MDRKRRRILILQGHPDPGGGHFGHALAQAYADGARAAGHAVRVVAVGRLKFPALRTAEDFERGAPPRDIVRAQAALRWAQHVVVFFPLWLGTMPAVLKAFFEQAFRPGFAMDFGGKGRLPRKLLAGRSARVVVTMGMPGLMYRWLYHAHGVRGLERSILAFSGFDPVEDTLIGMVGAPDARQRRKWLKELARLGGEAA